MPVQSRKATGMAPDGKGTAAYTLRRSALDRSNILQVRHGFVPRDRGQGFEGRGRNLIADEAHRTIGEGGHGSAGMQAAELPAGADVRVLGIQTANGRWSTGGPGAVVLCG